MCRNYKYSDSDESEEGEESSHHGLEAGSLSYKVQGLLSVELMHQARCLVQETG